MTLLPPYLDMPFSVAAGGEFVGRHLSGRDISYGLAVAWLAARGSPEDGTDDHFRIPDNRLRASLGRNRRDSIDAETARYDRLRGAVMRMDVDLPMPTVMYKGDVPVRANLDDEMTWLVDPRVVELFRAGLPSVSLPTALLANARNSSTTELVMRLLAAHARGTEAPGVEAWATDRIGLRMTFEDLAARFHLPATTAPSILLSRYLQPAAADAFEACGISIEIEARRAYTHRNPKGKLRDVLIYMVLAAPGPLAVKVAEQQKGSWTRRQATGKKRGRPARKTEEPGVADASNVTTLRPRGGPAYGSTAFAKKQPIVSGLSPDFDDTVDF